MSTENHPEPTLIVIFGAGGDLTWRKLVPALFDLYLDKRLPEQFAVIGVEGKPFPDEEFRQHLGEGVDRFSRRGKADQAAWKAFAPRLTCIHGDFADPDAFGRLANRLADQEKA
ncbi:MAG TPA: glucose-6-phosphate dehydrogenase, partial [Candidatus Methylomirabilis sp.]|nr:glucose-6-phosphate dehydrogenase [Candidatus Methylomirabilis sp.]